MATPRPKEFETYDAPRLGGKSSYELEQARSYYAPEKRGEAFAFGTNQATGDVTRVATNIPSASSFLPDMGFTPRPAEPDQATVRPVAAPGESLGGQAPAPASARPQEPVKEPVRPSALNPLGKDLSDREMFERQKFARNPNAFSPAERNAVFGQIERERQQALQIQQQKVATEKSEREHQKEIEIEEAKGRVKLGVEGALASQQQSFVERNKEADQKFKAQEAEIDRLFKSGQREAAEQASLKLQEAKYELAGKNALELAEAKGEVVGSDEYKAKLKDEVAVQAGKLASEANISVEQARQRLVTTMLPEVFKQTITSASIESDDVDVKAAMDEARGIVENLLGEVSNAPASPFTPPAPANQQTAQASPQASAPAATSQQASSVAGDLDGDGQVDVQSLSDRNALIREGERLLLQEVTNPNADEAKIDYIKKRLGVLRSLKFDNA